MNLRVEKRDLFLVPSEYQLAHCVSSDFALGAGIAVEFNRRFDMSNKLKSLGDSRYPNTIRIDRVYNMITKEKYWHKPTYADLEKAFQVLIDLAVVRGDTKIAMPKIGCGLDRLDWYNVELIIKTNAELRGFNGEILVCYI